MNLKTTYLGLELKHPLMASASPLSKTADQIKLLEEAGAAAVVMHSLFEEQLTLEEQQLDNTLNYGTESSGEALSYFPELGSFNIGPDEYLEQIALAKKSVDVPVIASLNGVTTGWWIDYAKKIEEAGADALELNVYYIPNRIDQSGSEVEELYLDVLREVKRGVSIPIAMKLSPFFSSTPNMAYKLSKEGADGLVLFNRFYQPDLDLEKLEVVPNLILSSSYEMRLPLLWIAVLFGKVKTDFALTTGIHNHLDVLKAMMVGANVAMMTSEMLSKGRGRFKEILHEMAQWMEEHEYDSVEQMRGSMSQKNVADPSAFKRANYMKMLASFRPDPNSQLP